MKRPNSKAKGSEFERVVCRQLSLWLSRGLRDDLFWRSAASGARATVRFRKGFSNRTQTGDISAIDPQGSRLTDRFMVECKFYRDLNLKGLFDKDKKEGFSSFWDKCQQDAEKASKLPMLVAKQNQARALVGLNLNGWLVFFPNGEEECIAKFPQHDLQIVGLDVFLMRARRPSI